MNLSRKDYVAGYELCWVIFKDPSNGFQEATKIGVLHNGEATATEYSALAVLFNVQFPFTDTIVCIRCKRDQDTWKAALYKSVLIRVAFEQADISLWDGSPTSRPQWMMNSDTPWSYTEVCVDAWGRFINHLVRLSWETGSPVSASINLVQSSFINHTKSFMGLINKTQPPTVKQATLFLDYCQASGLLEGGDPGPGGKLFAGSLTSSPGAPVLHRIMTNWWNSFFERPAERPDGWVGEVQGFGLRCAECIKVENPSIVSLVPGIINSI